MSELNKTGAAESRLGVGCYLMWLCLTLIVFAARPAIAHPTEEQNRDEVAGYEVELPALGTLVSIKVFSSDEQRVRTAIEAAEQRVKQLESTLTDYDPDSETARLTDLAVHKWVPVSEDLWKMLYASAVWHERSGGAFDASLGSLTRLWRGERRTKKVASPEQFEQARQASGWSHVRLDKGKQAVQLDRPGVRFDFGAIGKGFVVDAVFELLRERGLTRCLVNVSGNMRCGDPPSDRDGWRIAIAPLQPQDPPLRNLLLKNISIATSGDLWQFSIVNGERRSHIFDPRSGRSVRGPISATVIAATATAADACATAVCVLGPTEGAHWLATLPGIEGLILEQSDPEQSIRYVATPGFSSLGRGLND